MNFAEAGIARFSTFALFTPESGNFDRDVVGRDFMHWQRDPSVGDLADWQANYEANSSSTSSSTQIPEPSAIVLAVLSMLLGAGGISRKKLDIGCQLLLR